jgi:hypothetical protein
MADRKLPGPTVPNLGYTLGNYGNSPAPQRMDYGTGPQVQLQMIGGSAGVGYNNAPTNFTGSSMNAPNVSLAPMTSPRPPPNPNITKAGGGGKFWGEDGFNVGDVGTIADVIGGFGSIWSGIQANKLAKEEMALQKQAYQTNLASSISSYNLALEDRMRARYTQTDRSQAEASAYIDANRLKA